MPILEYFVFTVVSSISEENMSFMYFGLNILKVLLCKISIMFQLCAVYKRQTYFRFKHK